MSDNKTQPVATAADYGGHIYPLPVRLMGHALPWAIAVAFFFVAGGYLSFGTTIMIWILFAMSLDLVLGYAGIVTLGHAAYFGFGAYVAGIISVRYTGDPVIGHVAAILMSALLGFITGALILHTTGVTFLMLTLAIVSLMFEYANKAKELTGGDDGLQGMKVDPLFGIFEFNFYGTTAYVYVLVVLFFWFLVCWRLVHSPFGRSLDGIRQNSRRMRAIGTPVWWRLLAVYTISAGIAGSAGALSAHSTRFVGLDVLGLLTSGIVTVMLILGGTRKLYGAFVGAVVYSVVQDSTAKISPHFWEFIVGSMLILTVLFLEGGLMDLGRVFRNFMARFRKGSGAA
ncbi:MAG TPA: branched-chain amino acid ABC transporter permease [Xanthobacteraceae bacterium]|nr:branched-chain amino acid ABC transporter permease [Xanthobacteraceae bacterium]